MTTLDTSGKSAVASTSIWGGILAFAASVAPIVTQLAADGSLPASFVPYLGLLGSVLAIIGRFNATQKITSVVPTSSPS